MQFSGLKVEWDGSRAIGDRFIKIKLWDSTPIYVDGEFSKDILLSQLQILWLVVKETVILSFRSYSMERWRTDA